MKKLSSRRIFIDCIEGTCLFEKESEAEKFRETVKGVKYWFDLKVFETAEEAEKFIERRKLEKKISEITSKLTSEELEFLKENNYSLPKGV